MVLGKIRITDLSSTQVARKSKPLTKNPTEISLHLPELPYQKDALAPIITEKTPDYHYGKHHLAYVNNLKNIIKDTPLADASVEQLIQTGYQENNAALFNNAA